jgi:hypothetical protein
MKIYVHDKGIIMAGKAWEIRQKLLQYRRQYELVKDWVDDINKRQK